MWALLVNINLFSGERNQIKLNNIFIPFNSDGLHIDPFILVANVILLKLI